jgi:DNA-directed RNA polymerase I subunit RPA49
MKLSKAEAASHLIARLKLPLVFPKVKTGPSKRR